MSDTKTESGIRFEVEGKTADLAMHLPTKQIHSFCQKWEIIEFAIFGSFLRKDFRADSDFDVLVTFAENAKWTLIDLVRMEQELETIVGRSVDLIEKRGIERSQNWIRRDEILKTAVPINLGA